MVRDRDSQGDEMSQKCDRKAEEDVNRLTSQPRIAYSSLYLFIKGIKELQVKGQKRKD